MRENIRVIQIDENTKMLVKEVYIIGQRYIIDSDEPKKTKHRHRIGTLVEFAKPDEKGFIGSEVYMKFEDTKRVSKYDNIQDLRECPDFITMENLGRKKDKK